MPSDPSKLHDAIRHVLADDEHGIPKWATEMDIGNNLDTQSVEELEERLAEVENVLAMEVDKFGFSEKQVRNLLTFMRARRTLILNRIAVVSQQQRMKELEETVREKVNDPATQNMIADMVSESARQLERDTRRVRESEESVRWQKLEQRERIWNMRKSLLEREPVAVLIGGLLLLGIAIVLVLAMFTHTTVPEIVSSAFLLVLGYFFGQSNSRSGESRGKSD